VSETNEPMKLKWPLSFFSFIGKAPQGIEKLDLIICFFYRNLLLAQKKRAPRKPPAYCGTLFSWTPAAQELCICF
jgi:hypothetical protein